MKLAIICLAAGGLALSAPGQSGTTNTQPLKLQEALKLALEHNLDVQIERFNPQLALYTLNAYYGGYEPSLGVSGQHDYSKTGPQLFAGTEFPGSETEDNNFSSSLTGLAPWGTTYLIQGNAVDTHVSSLAGAFENTTASTSIKVTQPLLKNFLIDSTRLNIRVAKNRLKYSELNFKLRVMNTVAATEQAYYNLIYAREFVTVQQKAVELAMQLVVENQKRVEVGALAPLDEQQAEAQAATSQADLFTAQYNLATQDHALKNLITDQYTKWAAQEIEPTDPLSAPLKIFDRQESWNKGLTLRPDFLQAKLDVEKAGIQLKYAKNQLLPELDAFGTLGYNGSGTGYSGALGDISATDQPFYTYGGQITIPLGNTTARNNYKAGKATEQQAVMSLKKQEQQVLVQIDDAIRQAQSNYQRVAATRKAREYAEAALDAEQKKLQNGKSTTYTVLQMQRDLTAARGNEFQAMAAYNTALSQLSFQEGTILDRLGINIDMK
jgi:outer membrane protein TolC